ncbi:succinylglutamate desuccinylase/aspartoacylase family protein [Algiphilus sp.]|uniref:succinylglutamate desuccinylase/aspartoacylase family protein n=1 Tax=Algiphilus sp. TaxID=1872431 RepID=UPI003C4C81CB
MRESPRYRRIPTAVVLAVLAVLAGQPVAAVESDDETAQGAVQVATETLETVETPSARSVPEAAPTTPDPPTLDQALDAMMRSARSGPVAAFEILDGSIPPGETLQVPWYASDSFTGLAEPTPVLVAHGTEPGPTLCLTAAVHGDELNGIEMVRQLLYDVDPRGMRGTLIGVPIVNLFGFRQGSRYLPDRRDLNRHFPGDPDGSAASRIAHSMFENIVRHCDALVDLHTGSFHRTNLPQLRADLSKPDVAELTRGFGATVVLNSVPPEGTLREAATRAGAPTVTLEAGEPMRFQREQVEHGVRALRSLLSHLDMVPRFTLWGEPQPVYYESHWVRADDGGILTSRVDIGQEVSEGELLGNVTDPITNRRVQIRSPYTGRVIGMALNQAVIPGFAAYHIGVQRREAPATEAEPAADAATEAGAPAPDAPTPPDAAPEAVIAPDSLPDAAPAPSPAETENQPDPDNPERPD